MFLDVAVQGLAVALAVLVAFAWEGTPAGAAALYGGAAAMANSGLLLWRLKRGEKDYHSDAKRHLRSFYRSSLERFFVVGIWLALGLGGLRLAALPMLACFVVGLLAWVIAAAVRK